MLDRALGSNTNVKDLIASELTGKTSTYFNPRRDMTEYDWQNTERGLASELAKGQGYDGHAEFAVDVKFLAQFANKEIVMSYPDDYYNYYQNNIAEARMDKSWKYLLDDYYYIKYLFPERFSVIKPETGDFGNIKTILESDSSILNVSTKMDQALEIALAFPHRVSEIGLGSEDYQEALRTARSEREYGGYMNIASIAASTRLLFPQIPADEMVSANDWPEFRKMYQSLRGRDSAAAYTKFARDLTILSAASASITDQGIQIMMNNPDLVKTLDPIPQRRSF